MKTERRLFGLLLLLESAHFAWLVLGRRLPLAHDTLALYIQQYLFLAHATQAHSVALWMPYTAHGLATNLTASCQGGLFQNVLLLLGGVPEGINHLPVFYAGIYVDELILLVGVWRLGRHYYRSPYSRFFVAAGALGSSFWMDHLVCNFRIYYALPLLLSLVHEFLLTSRRRPLLLAGLLAALQFTGSTPYVPLFTLLVAGVYFAVHAFVHGLTPSGLIQTLRPRLQDALLFLAPLALVILEYLSLTHGAGDLRLFRPGRSADGTVPLDEFMTHGGALNPVRYLDLFLGVSPSLDYTLYCGILTVALAAVAVVHRPGKKVLVLVVTLLLIVLFSTGYLSAVAGISYFLVPPLHYSRYVALVAPCAKLFLILLSGFGFEALVSRRSELRRTLGGLSAGLVLGASLVALLAVASAGAHDTLSDLDAILRTARLGLGQRPAAEVRPSAVPLLVGAAAAMAAAAILLAFRAKSPRVSLRWVAVLLAVHAADLYRWKSQMTVQETLALGDEQYALQKIRPVPYVPGRMADYLENPRYQAMKTVLLDHGATYDFTDPYLGMDPPASKFLLSHWQAPFGALLAANDGWSVGRELKELPRLHFRTPSSGNPDPYPRITGAARDKLQVFSAAHVAGTDSEVAHLMNCSEFVGDELLLSSRPGSVSPTLPRVVLSQHERLMAAPTVLHFDFDSISVKVDVPSGGWLFYADVWNPGWTATVNGAPASVERAFLAYKAVKLEPGTNRVEFRFRDPVRSICYRVIGAGSLLLLVAVGALGAGLLRPSAGAGLDRGSRDG